MTDVKKDAFPKEGILFTELCQRFPKKEKADRSFVEPRIYLEAAAI